jgi:hypothetical protein
MNEPDGADRWSGQLGHAWAELLRGRALGQTDTVVEVGPGFTDKVARALAALDFRGRVVLVEPNRAAAAWAAACYRRRLPRAETLIVSRPVPDVTIPGGGRVDALVANHVLDDLILNATLRPEASEAIFSSMTAGSACSEQFVRTWWGLLARPGTLGRLTSAAAAHFSGFVAEARPRLVLLNQYPSWRHRARGLGPIHTHALRLMALLESSLGGTCMDSALRTESGGSVPVRWLHASSD